MEEPRPRPKGLRVPIAAALGGAALMPASCLAMIALVERTGDLEQFEDSDLDRFLSLAAAIGGVMEASFFISSWATWVVVSRLLHARPTRTRRIVATAVTIAWFAGLVAVQFAMLDSMLD